MTDATVRPSAPPAVRSTPPPRLLARAGYVIAGLSAVLYAAFSLVLHAAYRSAGYDLGLNYQLVQSYARFQVPHSDIVGRHVNLLGDHFSPAMALLAPVYWLWQDPRALLLAQAGLVALSVLPVHRFALRRLGPGAAATVAAGYALGWPLQEMIGFDVHEVMFAVPLVAFALDALDRRADRALLLAGLGLVLGLAYGALMNLWFWPFAGYGDGLSYLPGGGLGDNLAAYGRFYVATSLVWDGARGVTTALVLLLVGRPLIRALTRVARLAAFDAPVEFADR